MRVKPELRAALRKLGLRAQVGRSDIWIFDEGSFSKFFDLRDDRRKLEFEQFTEQLIVRATDAKAAS